MLILIKEYKHIALELETEYFLDVTIKVYTGVISYVPTKRHAIIYYTTIAARQKECLIRLLALCESHFRFIR
jgi:hypothetical protein